MFGIKDIRIIQLLFFLVIKDSVEGFKDGMKRCKVLFYYLIILN